MTAPDQRLNEIQARLAEVAQLQNSRAEHSDLDAAVYRSQSDVAFLLAELRKAHEALERVEGVAGRLEARAALNARVSGTGIYDDAMQLAADAATSIATITATDLRAAVAAAKGDVEQAYIVECEDLVPGDQIWFKNLSEAEETCGPFPSCCVPKPVGPDYDGPRWVPEDEESE